MFKKIPLYLDNNATTAIDPAVLNGMLEAYACPLNPSSLHSLGQRAKEQMEQARRRLATCLQVKPEEFLFTSGSTETINTFLLGFPFPKQAHIITSTLEHAAVLKPLALLEKRGIEITYLSPLPQQGTLLPEQIEAAIRPHTSLIVVMAANNETGVISPLHSIAEIAERHDIPLFVDAAAWFGKTHFHLLPKTVAGYCLSGHKIHGPHGIGLGVIKKSLKISPLIQGGPQQRGMRAGTENVPGIIGLSHAVEILSQKPQTTFSQLASLRDYFEMALSTTLGDLIIHGQKENRLCNTSNIAFLGVDGETLLMRLDLCGLAASHGSACSSGALEPSRVLLEMGISRDIVRSSIRFSLSQFTTQDEIDRAIEVISHEVKALRHYAQKA